MEISVQSVRILNCVQSKYVQKLCALIEKLMLFLDYLLDSYWLGVVEKL